MHGRNIDFTALKNGGNDLYHEVHEKYLSKSTLTNTKANVYAFSTVTIKKKEKE